MPIVIGVLAELVVFLFTIAFLIHWLRLRRQLRDYRKYAVVVGISFIAVEAIAFLFKLHTLDGPSIIAILIQDAVILVQLLLFTIVGIHLCKTMGIPSLPLLMRKLPVSPSVVRNHPDPSQVEKTLIWATTDQANCFRAPSCYDNGNTQAGIAEPFGGHCVPRISLKKYSFVIAAVALFAITYSAGLFILTSPRASDLAIEFFGDVEPGGFIDIPLACFLLLGAFSEEILFRLGIQNMAAKIFNWQGQRYWIAIIFTSLIWAAAHSGVMEPNWVKMMQIFPIGLSFGWLFRKYGTESCFLAHATLNLVLVIPAEYLVNV